MTPGDPEPVAARDAAAARIPALLAAMRDVIARYTFLVSIHGEIE